MADGFHLHVIETERCGTVKVWVQGDLEAARKTDASEGGRPIFLTVHDIGKNSNSWRNFALHPSVLHVREKACFVHVDLLGQEDEAQDIKDDKKFPNMQELGEDLVNILDNLRIKHVIGLGDGAGANVMARFAAMHVTRCLGAILINPTAGVASFFDQFKDNMKAKLPKHILGSAENFLIMHRFGHKMAMSEDAETEEWTEAFAKYTATMKATTLNLKNANMYVQAYMDRDEITGKMKTVQDDLLLLAGAKSSYAATMEAMYAFCNKTKTSCLKIDDVADVLDEAPAKLANSLLLFCKGMGLLTSLATAGLDRHRTVSTSSNDGAPTGRMGRRMSMEDYDTPNIARLALASQTSKDEENEDKD